jgi:hypothetical protein
MTKPLQLLLKPLQLLLISETIVKKTKEEMIIMTKEEMVIKTKDIDMSTPWI